MKRRGIMKELATWGRKSKFKYRGSIENGTTIIYGKGYSIIVTKEQYISLLNHFRGKTVDAGTSRTDAPQGSVGKWLQINVTKTAIASYVCPILIVEGYAEGIGKSQLKFRRE